MFQIFHVETVENFFTVSASTQSKAVQMCAVRERVRMPEIVRVSAVVGCFTGREAILGQEAA